MVHYTLTVMWTGCTSVQKQKGGRGLISSEEMCVKAFTKLDAPYNDLHTGDKIKIPI